MPGHTYIKLQRNVHLHKRTAVAKQRYATCMYLISPFITYSKLSKSLRHTHICISSHSLSPFSPHLPLSLHTSEQYPPTLRHSAYARHPKLYIFSYNKDSKIFPCPRRESTKGGKCTAWLILTFGTSWRGWLTSTPASLPPRRKAGTY